MLSTGHHALRTINSAGPSGVSTMRSSLESGFLIGAHRPARLQGSGSVTMRGAPAASLPSTKHRISADPWPRSIIVGFADEEIDAAGAPADGLRTPNSTPSGRSTADIRNRRRPRRR